MLVTIIKIGSDNKTSAGGIFTMQRNAFAKAI